MKRYIIFGAGCYGEEALLYYGTKNVAYFCDNKRHGAMINGVQVISFDELRAIWKAYQVVLAVSAPVAQKEMIGQLEACGITYEMFDKLESQHNFHFEGAYQFIDRSKSKEKLLMVLAGYKEYLWDAVFSRIKAYLPEDIDVCIMTAGYENERLKKYCEEEDWSYLWTSENKLSLTQNLTIKCHPAAKWIYKMDEDIFLTPGIFEKLLDTWNDVENERKYAIGLVAPLMAVNGYGYRRILEYIDCLPEYEEQFGECILGRGNVYGNPDVAEYLWKKTLPINEFAARIEKIGSKYSICYHRFSIGCMLIKRNIWEEMGGFRIASEGVLGVDEEFLCKWCMNTARAIVIAEQAFAGHFAYGLQTESMKAFYAKHKDEFDR